MVTKTAKNLTHIGGGPKDQNEGENLDTVVNKNY